MRLRMSPMLSWRAIPKISNSRDIRRPILVYIPMFSLHRREFIPMYRPRRHRPQDPAPAADRQPHHHAGARRQGRPLGVALPPPGQTAGRARRHHPLHRHSSTRNRVGLPVSVFISIKLARQKEEDLNRFAKAISKWDEVLECYLMTGNRDYLAARRGGRSVVL